MFFFVQVGAMDGVTHDPIHRLIKELAWRGLLVEPIPYLNKKLQENYAGCEGLRFAETAITDFDGRITMTFIDPSTVKEGVFEPGAFGTSTIMLDRGLLSGKDMPEYAAQIFKQNASAIDVPCCRLKTLLDTHQISKLDLMVVDAEGADWMIVRQLPLDEYQPRIVYFEYYHLSSYEKIACAAHFSNHGYSIYLDQNCSANFLAVRAS